MLVIIGACSFTLPSREQYTYTQSHQRAVRCGSLFYPLVRPKNRQIHRMQEDSIPSARRPASSSSNLASTLTPMGPVKDPAVSLRFWSALLRFSRSGEINSAKCSWGRQFIGSRLVSLSSSSCVTQCRTLTSCFCIQPGRQARQVLFSWRGGRPDQRCRRTERKRTTVGNKIKSHYVL